MKKYYCKECGKIISSISYLYGRKLCKSCSRKLDWKQEKYNKRNFCKENNPNYKHGKCNRDNRCLDCGNLISHGSVRCQRCDDKFRPLKLKGKNSHFFGKVLKPKWKQYKKIWMRSNWEVAYAKYLNKNHIKWLYEPKTFDLGNTTYTPDFYLIETNTYIEIKGYKSDIFIKKFKLFKGKFKNTKIGLLQYQDLIKLNIIKRR